MDNYAFPLTSNSQNFLTMCFSAFSAFCGLPKSESVRNGTEQNRAGAGTPPLARWPNFMPPRTRRSATAATLRYTPTGQSVLVAAASAAAASTSTSRGLKACAVPCRAHRFCSHTFRLIGLGLWYLRPWVRMTGWLDGWRCECDTLFCILHCMIDCRRANKRMCPGQRQGWRSPLEIKLLK